MVEHQFNSVLDLSKHLGISRTTLYKRAKESHIKLSGVYSDEQLKKLSSVQQTVQQLDTQNEQIGHSTGQIEHKNEQF